MFVVADTAGPDAANSLIRELRTTALKLGNSTILAAVHIFIGQMEAKRGLLKNAERHSRVGQQLLAHAPNVWLDTMVENTLLCTSLLLSDFDGASRHARRALQLAEQSGGVVVRAMTITNYGSLLHQVGRFDEAIEHHRRALAIMPVDSDTSTAALESIAKAHLAQGQLDECGRILDEVDAALHADPDDSNYLRRYTEFTRADYLARSGKTELALKKVATVVGLAEKGGDHLLRRMALLLKADLLQQSARISTPLQDVRISWSDDTWNAA